MVTEINQEQMEKNEKLAGEIIGLLKEHGCWFDASLMYNNKRVSSNGRVEENVNVREMIEYCNPETITMTFEGPFYRAMNYGREFDNHKLYNQFNKLIEKYGYYFEFGHAWSLTLYK